MVNVLERLINMVAPHDCLVCGLEGHLLCAGCLNSELAGTASRCYRCHVASRNQAVCRNCRREVSLRHVWTATEYDEVPKKLVHRLKFERAVAAARPIAEKIDQTAPVLPRGTVICHIPTAASRIRERGYDQAEEIAKYLSKIRGYPHKTLLIRRGKFRQTGSSRTNRFKHLKKAFEAKDFNLKNTDVLLVDDVATTGATIEAAAKVLKKAGAKTVNAVVFARA